MSTPLEPIVAELSALRRERDTFERKLTAALLDLNRYRQLCASLEKTVRSLRARRKA